MSESNAPSNYPNQSDADTVDWENPFTNFADSLHSQDDRSLEELFFEAEAPPVDELATLKDFPTEVSPRPAPPPTAAIAAWPDAATDADVDVTNLISLIQELNQCNSILLDRVSQLEEALESSQVALQAEVGRSQDGVEPQADISTPPEAIVSLFNQLEFAHQANQRQQILIETLTGQLESSQERVAELERESALIQQRYNEQVQILGQTESSNRDLQARLHRQQRYTLQFKTALEKCLEVPTPQYDLGAEAMAEAIMGDNPFLLKTQKIQPWSAQADAIAPPWMKLGGLIELDELGEESVTPASPNAPDELEKSFKQLVDLPDLENAAFKISSQDSLVQQAMQILPELLAIEPNQTNHEVNLEISNPENHEAIASLPFEAQPSPVILPVELPTELPVEAEIRSSLSDQVPDRMSSPEGEDALWQDLARLIEVSTEDMVRASLSGDFSAFESINFDALPKDALPKTEPMPQPIPKAAQAESQPISIASETQNMPEAALTSEEPDSETEEKSFIPALSQPSWPSPVVYPLRSVQKQRSSGVDLPSFLRPGTDPLPT